MYKYMNKIKINFHTMYIRLETPKCTCVHTYARDVILQVCPNRA